MQRLFETLSIVVADILILCGATGTWDSVSEVVVREFETELYEVVNSQDHRGKFYVSRDVRVIEHYCRPRWYYRTNRVRRH